MPNFAGIVIEIIGDAKSYLRSAQQTIAMNERLAGSTVSTNTAIVESSQLSAKALVAGTEKAIAATEAQIAALKALQVQGVKTYGLIAAEEAKLARLTGATASPTLFARAKGFAGVAGVGFLSAAAGAEIVKRSILQAEELEAAQRSLDVAIAHTGGNVDELGAQYLATAKAAAKFGVDQITATQGLARATVLTGDAASAQRAYEEALVISKALGKDFNATLTATAKAQEGITTSLKRYGILVDRTTSGQEQFNIIMKRFEGQAEANTTATEKFNAELTNLGTELGTTILPILTPMIEGFAGLLHVINKFPEALNLMVDAFVPVKLAFDAFSKAKNALFPSHPHLNAAVEAANIQRAVQVSFPDLLSGAIGGFFRFGKGGGKVGFGGAIDHFVRAIEELAKTLADGAAKAEKAKERIAEQIQNSIDPIALEVQLAKDRALGRPIRKDLLALKRAAQKALASGKLSLEQQLEAWDQIASLNAQLSNQLTNQATAQVKGIRAANTRILTADLGLTRAQRDELRARLASLDARGRSLHHAGVGAFGYEIGHSGRPIQVRVDLDGRKVAENTTRHQQRRRRRNSSQRRGPNAGD